MACCLAVYLLSVLWYTIGKRSAGYYPGYFDLFWSYRLWFAGKQVYGHAILANIAMFVPFGFLAAETIEKNAGLKTILMAAFLALVFSTLIETAQLLLMRGYFEFDDIFNNVLGAVLGAALFRLIKRFLPEKYLRAALYAAGAGIVLFCLGLILFSDDDGEWAVQPLPLGLCFQVEEASYGEEGMQISGVCFWYERERTDFSIVLQSTRTGERHSLQTKCGLPRQDVAACFHRDGLKAGLQAEGKGIGKNEEYEIILDFGFFRFIPTGVFLTAEQKDEAEQAKMDVHFVSSCVFLPLDTEGTDLEKLVTDGVLRVYNPENHVYVYAYDGSLYWITEEGFHYDENGTTRLEVLLWTADAGQSSAENRDAGKPDKTFGVYLEKYELTGDFGRYSVSARELPADHFVTAVKTGYYADGWVWQETFWPVFDFSR